MGLRRVTRKSLPNLAVPACECVAARVSTITIHPPMPWPGQCSVEPVFMLSLGHTCYNDTIIHITQSSAMLSLHFGFTRKKTMRVILSNLFDIEVTLLESIYCIIMSEKKVIEWKGQMWYVFFLEALSERSDLEWCYGWWKQTHKILLN